MERLRDAGWLVLVPPLALGLEILRAFETAGVRSSVTRDFLEGQFGFWTSALAGEFRFRVFMNLALFVGAIVVGLLAVTRGVAVQAVIAVAVAQLVVALVGWVWDVRDMPDALQHVVPVEFGQWTSAFFVVCAALALACATRARTFPGRR